MLEKFKKNIKRRIANWIMDSVLYKYGYKTKDWILHEIECAKEDVCADTVSRDSFEYFEYEVDEQENNISDHEDRIDVLEEKLKKYDKIFSKLKSVDSWEVTVRPNGESKIKTVTSVPKEKNTAEE